MTIYTLQNPYPLLAIDEGTMNPAAFKVQVFPLKPWNEAQACLALQGVPIDTMPLPALLVVPPIVNSIRLTDVTGDSLNHGSQGFSAPTVGYTFVHSNAIVIVARYEAHDTLLRHEAIHKILWDTLRLFGHTVEINEKYFRPCDREYRP